MGVGPAMAVWCLAAFVMSAAATVLARRYAERRGLLDQPGERRSHVLATPRGGGIAIVLVLVVALPLIAHRQPGFAMLAWAALVGLVMVAAVGWADDHRPLPASFRLVTHVVAAAILAWALHAGGASWPWVGVAFGLALVLVNIWNFMDGIDGLAASQCALVAAAYAVLLPGPVAPWLAAALAAAACGFLPFNFPRARIFLGDVGSGAIGYTLAAVLVCGLAARPSGEQGSWLAVEPLAWLLPLSAFSVDASLTLLRRVLRGERWWTPHVTHAYQRTARRAGSHVGTTLGYAAWTLAGIGLMVAVQGRGAAAIMAATVAWHGLAVAVWLWLQHDRAEGRDA